MFARAADGARRCLPTHVARSALYTDALCTTIAGYPSPIYTVDPPFFYDPSDIDFDPTNHRILTAGASLYPAPTLYSWYLQKDGGAGCAPVPPSIQSQNAGCYVLDETPPPFFERATRFVE
jgi:hypothetical protein